VSLRSAWRRSCGARWKLQPILQQGLSLSLGRRCNQPLPSEHAFVTLVNTSKEGRETAFLAVNHFYLEVQFLVMRQLGQLLRTRSTGLMLDRWMVWYFPQYDLTSHEALIIQLLFFSFKNVFILKVKVSFLWESSFRFSQVTRSRGTWLKVSILGPVKCLIPSIFEIVWKNKILFLITSACSQPLFFSDTRITVHLLNLYFRKITF